MAHPCAICGSECYCSGDIDDVIVSKTPKGCETCGCESKDDEWDDDEWDDDEDAAPEYYQCLGCQWSGTENPGDICPRCGGMSIDGVF